MFETVIPFGDECVVVVFQDVDTLVTARVSRYLQARSTDSEEQPYIQNNDTKNEILTRFGRKLQKSWRKKKF